MSHEDKVYKIIPVDGGFEAAWGLSHKALPVASTHEWKTDKMATASYIVEGPNGERMWADGRKVDPDYPFVGSK